MSPLKGFRVVRGPDWKYGDQDGGEGHAGTVIDSSDLNHLGPKTVTVIWDTGVTARYRSGPEGAYDLRIVSNVATGIKHPNILCTDCGIKEICGTRWQCVTCHVNLCSSCFFKEAPHDQEHSQFKRYDSDLISEPPIVSSWIVDGPKSRIALKGTYNGAKVTVQGQKDLSRFGLVIPDPEAELSGKIAVKWTSKRKMSRIYYERCVEGKLIFEMKEIGSGGFYNPEALPPLHTPFENSLAPRPAFCVGDRVCIDPEIKTDHEGFSKEMEELKGVAGTVESLTESELLVDYKEKEKKLRLNPSAYKKLNKYSINDVIRIRSDEVTIREIEIDFGSLSGFERIDGSIGRVCGIVESDPEMLYVQLDDDKFYKWLPKDEYLSSKWMELFETLQPSVEEELVELISKGVDLFINAVNRGDLRVAKLLLNRAGVDVDARNTDGRTALHVACQQGHKEIIKWLLDVAKADLEVADNDGFRAIHHAVMRCDPEIIEILTKKGVELDSQDHPGRTALHVAVIHRFKECSLLLIQHGCNVNLQDSDGSTPLHCALDLKALELIEILIASGRIDWMLGTKKKLSVLHLAISSNVNEVIGILLKDYENLLFNWTSNVGSTVLHLACMFNNFPVAKLLIDHLTVQKHLLGSSSKMEFFLEMKNGAGRTALSIACRKKSIAIIELLVDAGANVKFVDDEGNSAIINVASSAVKDEIPSMDLCPSIFKFFSNGEDESNKKLMEHHPILPVIAYLLYFGSSWETVNKAGKKATDILLEKGYPKDVIETLDITAARWKRWIIGANGCMGRGGECAEPAMFRLSCSHKATYCACKKCFVFKELKCGCDDEDILPIQSFEPKKEQEPPKEREEPAKQNPPKEDPPKEAPPKENPPIPPKETPPKETPPKETPPKEAPPKEAPPKEAPPKEAPPKEAPPKEAPPKEAPPKETPPKEAPPKEGPPKEALPKEAPPKDKENPQEEEDEDTEEEELEGLVQQRLVVKDENQKAEGAAAPVKFSYSTNYSFLWVDNGTQHGYIVDQLGQSYTWNQMKPRMDGGVGYKCVNLWEKRCTAVVRRFVTDEQEIMYLEKPHSHQMPNKRKSSDAGGSQEMPAAKKNRASLP